MEENTVKKGSGVINLVVDSAGFLKNVSLKDIGENIYTEAGVVGEIKDRATKERLQVLPYELKYKRPSPEDIKFVTDFSKKTGDYCSLSAVDLRVIALTYHLQKELVGLDTIRTTPFQKELSYGSKDKQLPFGFYIEKESYVDDTRNSDSEYEDNPNKDEDNPNNDEDNPNKDEDNPNKDDDNPNKDEDNPNKGEDNHNKDEDYAEDNVNHSEDNDSEDSYVSALDELQIVGEEDEQIEAVDHDNDEGNDDYSFYEDNSKEDDNDDDDDGWVTVKNIKNAKDSDADVVAIDPNAPLTVACLTTDYAIQNVLMQMGLNVISVDGMLIKKLKMYILRCGSCYKTTKDMTKKFCPHCGHTTLRKTSYSINEDGTFTYYMSKRPFNKKGLKYSLPTPRGGKYSNNPILSADQRIPQQRLTKAARINVDPLDTDYIARESPFAAKDVNSRAVAHGFNTKRVGWRNPNENRKKQSKRK